MSTLALRGFQSLRTVHNRPTPVDPALLPPRRRCVALKPNGKPCGAILRRSNPSTICAPCAGHVDIPGWALAMLEEDARPHTIMALAAVIMGEPADNYRRVDCADEIERLREGGMSQGQIAKAVGRKKTSVQHVLKRKRAAAGGPGATRQEQE